MKEEYITQTEALAYLGLHINTFKRYAQRLGIKSIRSETDGRCAMYLRSDIERMNNVYAERVPILINMLEHLTGCEVKLIDKK